MITAGLDCGAKNTKVILLKEGKVLGKGMVLSGFDQKASSEEAFDQALRAAGIGRGDVTRVFASGAGMKEAALAQGTVTELTAVAKAAVAFFPKAKTVIDVGAEEGRAIRTDEKGRVQDFVINEKCAAGAGAFTEAMARALEVKVEDFGPLSLQSSQTIPMNAQCAVFAESEVISLLHAKTPKPDIAKAVNDAIASRISSMARRVSVEPDVILVGGMAYNVGFVKSLKDALSVELIIPESPEFFCAYGAALAAAEDGTA